MHNIVLVGGNLYLLCARDESDVAKSGEAMGVRPPRWASFFVVGPTNLRCVAISKRSVYHVACLLGWLVCMNNND